VANQVLIFEHLLHGVGQGNSYGQGETLRDGDDDDGHGDDEGGQDVHEGSGFPLGGDENLAGVSVDGLAGAAERSALAGIGPVVGILFVASLVAHGIGTVDGGHGVDTVHDVVNEEDEEHQSGYNGSHLTNQDDLGFREKSDKTPKLTKSSNFSCKGVGGCSSTTKARVLPHSVLIPTARTNMYADPLVTKQPE
jgi:hypothetical protein